MGMDVIGLKPANSTGKYFRNSVFYWIPLWGYIAHACSDIVTRREKATAIGKRPAQPTSHREDSGVC
jgi:hypothetical protein